MRNKLWTAGFAGLAAYALLAWITLAIWALATGPAGAQSATALMGWQCKTSQPVGWCPITQMPPYTYSRKTADGQVKASAGFIHSISVAGLTATPTAGLMTVYDSTAESGTVIYSEWVFATVVGHTIALDVSAATGIYVGFDATLANAQVTVAYR